MRRWARSASPADKLVENAASLIQAVIKAKPAVAKGKYVKSATLCSTMSPGISIDVTEFSVKAAVLRAREDQHEKTRRQEERRSKRCARSWKRRRTSS